MQIDWTNIVFYRNIVESKVLLSTFVYNSKNITLTPKASCSMWSVKLWTHIHHQCCWCHSSSAGLCVNMVKRKLFKTFLFMYHFKFGNFFELDFWLTCILTLKHQHSMGLKTTQPTWHLLFDMIRKETEGYRAHNWKVPILNSFRATNFSWINVT